MCKSSEQVRHRNHASGFTLVEFAIVMVIFGILLVPILQLYKHYAQEKVRIATNTAQSETANALGVFYSKNGRYPCPAGLNLPPTNANYGLEDCTGATALAVGACTPDQVCKAQGLGSGPQNVLIGAVPFATLEMEGLYALDGRHNKLYYMVGEGLTNSATFVTSGPQIEQLSAGSPVSNPYSPANPTGNPLLQGIIFSTGTNGTGTYSNNGVLQAPCTGAGLDVENCNMDGMIFAGQYSEAAGANYFDDVLGLQAWVNPNLWDYVPSGGNSIESKNTGNVGIGTNNPQYKLDVVGDVRADGALNTQQICYQDTSTTPPTTNCFSVDKIGGPVNVAWTCPPNEFMVGLASGQQQCVTVPLANITNVVCAPGTYIQSIDTTTTPPSVVCVP